MLTRAGGAGSRYARYFPVSDPVCHMRVFGPGPVMRFNFVKHF